jgi:hypothetical protein
VDELHVVAVDAAEGRSVASMPSRGYLATMLE